MLTARRLKFRERRREAEGFLARDGKPEIRTSSSRKKTAVREEGSALTAWHGRAPVTNNTRELRPGCGLLGGGVHGLGRPRDQGLGQGLQTSVRPPGKYFRPSKPRISPERLSGAPAARGGGGVWWAATGRR